MINKRYIVVEGPLGVGKSSLSQRLAAHWGMTLLEDQPQANPFLAKFYQQFQHYAFATQLNFLLTRQHLAHEMMHGALLERPVISDFMFERDALFAKINLEEDEQSLFLRLLSRLEFEYPVPDLVIYLDASAETLIARLANRMDTTNRNFPDGYLARVQAAYQQFFFDYQSSPLLIVNTDHLDLANDPDDFELLISCIHDMRGQRSFFNKSI